MSSDVYQDLVKELAAVERENGAREARVEMLLKDIWELLRSGQVQRHDIMDLVNRLLRLQEATYNTTQLIYQLLCSIAGAEMKEANQIQTEFSRRALDRDSQALAARSVRAGISIEADTVRVGGDVAGRDKMEVGDIEDSEVKVGSGETKKPPG